MRAALIWTINDFPRYGMSRHGKLGCPYCMGDTKAFRLKHGGKPCWFDCHQRFLPMNHPYRGKCNDFFRGRIERGIAPHVLNKEEVINGVFSKASFLCYRLKLPRQKFLGYGETHN